MSAPNQELLSINSVTVRDQYNLRDLVKACARRGIRGIAPWRDKLAEVGAKEAAKMFRDNGITATSLCRAGMFPAADRKGRRDVYDENRRAVDEAAIIEAKNLVIIAGGLPAGSKDLPGAWEMVRDGLGALLDHARSVGVPLALEPLHPMFAADRACVNTLRHALDICDELDSSKSGALGVAVDAYHVWWDPECEKQIERAGEKRLLGFHLCDWLVPTTDMLLDRGMMGDGVIDLPKLRGWVERVGFHGFHEVEILSKKWWQRPGDEVLAIAQERHQTVC
ncbi:MAG: sugar phosphate isomerase/epimerase family protein [Burkholderiales bacterium]